VSSSSSSSLETGGSSKFFGVFSFSEVLKLDKSVGGAWFLFKPTILPDILARGLLLRSGIVIDEKVGVAE
jgi:hypothetical protein